MFLEMSLSYTIYIGGGKSETNYSPLPLKKKKEKKHSCDVCDVSGMSLGHLRGQGLISDLKIN